MRALVLFIAAVLSAPAFAQDGLRKIVREEYAALKKDKAEIVEELGEWFEAIEKEWNLSDFTFAEPEELLHARLALIALGKKCEELEEEKRKTNNPRARTLIENQRERLEKDARNAVDVLFNYEQYVRPVVQCKKGEFLISGQLVFWDSTPSIFRKFEVSVKNGMAVQVLIAEWTNRGDLSKSLKRSDSDPEKFKYSMGQETFELYEVLGKCKLTRIGKVLNLQIATIYDHFKNETSKQHVELEAIAKKMREIEEDPELGEYVEDLVEKED